MVGFLGFLRKPQMAEDPVCHMEVDVKKPNGGTHEHNGETYYFCGAGVPRRVLEGAGRVSLRRKADGDVAGRAANFGDTRGAWAPYEAIGRGARI